MTDSQAPSPATPSNAAHTGVKKGLPTVGLPQAEQSAAKLWEVARRGMTSKQLFGNTIGMNSVTGSSFRTRLALLRGFGLIKVDNEQVGLTDLGLQLVQAYDEEAKRSARRAAILSLKAYNDIVTTFDGTALPSSDRLTAKLKFDYGKTDEFAAQAAGAVFESLKHAEMLDVSNIVHKNGVVANADAPAAHENQEDVRTPSDEVAGMLVEGGELSEEDKVAAELDAAFTDVDDGTGDSRDDSVSSDARRKYGQVAEKEVSLAVTLDLSRFRAEEVIRILQVLGLGKHV